MAAATAGPRDDVLNALLKCADLADKGARVACFDQATPQLRAIAAMPLARPPASAPPTTAPVAAEAPAAPSEPPPQRSESIFSALDVFGDTPPPSREQMAYQSIGQEVLPITIGIADYEVLPRGGFSVTLVNGQVWRSRKEHYETPHFRGDGRNVVTIERGLIGGYNMYVQGSAGLFKVDRIK